MEILPRMDYILKRLPMEKGMMKRRIVLILLGASGMGLAAVALFCVQCHAVLRWTAVGLFSAVGLALIVIALFAGDRYVKDTLKNVSWKDF